MRRYAGRRTRPDVYKRQHICIGAAAANDAVGIAENEERTAAHARCGIENDDHSALRSVKMQLVVFGVACQLAGDGSSVFCIDSNISYLGAADDFSSMKISVGAACYIKMCIRDRCHPGLAGEPEGGVHPL